MAVLQLSQGKVMAGGYVEKNKVAQAAFTVGTEAANVINVAIQLNDNLGNAIATRASVLAYLSDDANGDSVAATAPSVGVSVGTDGLCIEYIANKAFLLTSESDGDIDLDIEEVSVDTWYLVLVMPDGSLSVSGAITFA